MKKACVIGWPIAHSRSPLIHNHWIRKYGLNAIYEKKAVSPEHIEAFLASFVHSGLVGCNITVPHKEIVFRKITQVDAATRRLGAINTLYIRDGVVYGTNTDGEGFLANLHQHHPSHAINANKVAIIGAGGAAKAIIGALVDGGVETISVINRTQERIEALRQQFGPRVNAAAQPANLADYDLLINTTSLGMSGQPPLEIDIDSLPRQAIVSDIVYSPLETDLLQRAKQRGNRTLGGLGMLLHQAVRGFELWFGVRPEVTSELYDLVAADVRRTEP
jgi:shikimate dehydrogenase